MKIKHPEQRFAWLVGSIKEEMPDVPGYENEHRREGHLVLWDRQERKEVANIRREYAQLMCLELNSAPQDQPFTTLESWMNSLSASALQSEGINPTLPPFHT